MIISLLRLSETKARIGEIAIDRKKAHPAASHRYDEHCGAKSTSAKKIFGHVSEWWELMRRRF